MSSSGLTPPWNTNQAALNAIEVTTSNEFREDRTLTVWCTHCSRPRKRLLRVFVGPLDTGETRGFLYAPSYMLSGRAVPALCYPAPKPGEVWRPLYAHCGRCRHGVSVLYPGEGVDAPSIAEQGGWVLARFGPPEDKPHEEGDETSAMKIAGEGPGPCGSRLLYLDPPTLGVVQP